MLRGGMAEGLGRNCSAGTVLSGFYYQRRKRPRGNGTLSGTVQDYQEGRKNMKKSYRPGVYSQYDIISKPKSYEQRYAFFCGGSKVKEEKSIPANTVVQLHSVEELKEYFLEEGSGKVFCSIARMLLESGISGLYVVPITTDGSAPATEDYAAAIQKLCEIKKSGVILCDSSDQSVLQVLKDKTQEASQNQRERVAVAAVPKSDAQSIAQSLNCERMVLCCQESGSSFAGEEKSVLFSAAAVATMLAVSQQQEEILPGEILLKSSGGASIRLCNDGTILLNGKKVE